MNPNDPTWDDTGFEPENNSEGFDPTPEQKSVPEQASVPEQKPITDPTPVPERRTIRSTSRTIAPVQPKRKRSALFWFSVLAAGVLLVAVIGGAVYYLTQPSTEEEAFVAPSEESPAVIVPPTTQPVDTIPSTTVEPQPVPKHDDAAIAALEGRELKNREIEKERIRKPEAESKPVEPKIVEPKKVEPKKVEPKKVEPKKVEPKKVIPPPQEVRQPTSSKAPLYVVQVFSSPSRDDADEWLQLLRGKNVGDGYITEQKIKGQSWYRVRFGQYTTRESAESEALRLGFKEPWIARVR